MVRKAIVVRGHGSQICDDEYEIMPYKDRHVCLYVVDIGVLWH